MRKCPLAGAFLCLLNFPEAPYRLRSILNRFLAMTMTRLALLLLLVVTCAPAAAEVYRWKDADGNVIFSDKPHDGAQIIELGPTTVVPGEPVAKDKASDASTQVEASEPTSYRSITVVAPGDDETLRDQQAVAVDVVIEPPLQTELGHRVQLYMDGAAYGEPSDSPYFVLPETDRGSHQLAAAVVDASDIELIRSTASVFHLHKTSVANPKTGKSRGPSKPAPPKAK